LPPALARLLPELPALPPFDPVMAARGVAREASARAADLDVSGDFPAEDVASLGSSGLLGAPAPISHGGHGLGSAALGSHALLDVLRLLGAGNLSVARLFEGHVNAWRLIARYGTAAQQRRLARDAAACHLFTVWNTQGKRPVTLKPIGPDRFRLDGAKTFASGAGAATRPMITARLPSGGIQLVVVPLPDDPKGRADLSRWQPQGMRASTSGSFDFTGIEVTAADLVGEPGDYAREPDFSAGAWRFAAAHLGGIEALIDTAREHLGRTGRGADPHQASRLGQMGIAAGTARLWLERAAKITADPDQDSAAMIAFVQLARLAVERAGLDVLELAERSIGVQGFLRPHPAERIGRDLRTYLRQPAPDQALVETAAHILDDPRPIGELWP
jgi:alkylation response protein AidB-like acyl-CoA dehydrogenase